MGKAKENPDVVLGDLSRLLDELKKHGDADAKIRQQADPQANAESLLIGVRSKLDDLLANPDFDRNEIKRLGSEANKYGAKSYLREIEKHFSDIDNNKGNLSRSLKDIIDKKKIVDGLQKSGGGKYLDEQEQKYLGAVEKRWEGQKVVVDLKYAYSLFEELPTGKVDPDKTLAEIKGLLKRRGVDARALNAEGKMPIKDRDSNIDEEALSMAKQRLEEAYREGNFKKGKRLVDELKDGIADPKELLPEINSRFAKAKLPKNTEQSLAEEIKTNTATGYIKRASRDLKSIEEYRDFEKLPRIKEALSVAGNAREKLNGEDASRLDELNKAYEEQKKMHDSLEQFNKGPKGKSSHNHTPAVPKAETRSR